MTTKLTATQQSVLKIAAQHEDRAIRWPDRLKGGAIKKVADALTSAGLARYEGDVLVATDEGLRAVGADPDSKPVTGGTRREGTKQARLIEMLQRPEGASISEIVAEFGWQPHTARGAIAGALKKKLGLTVTSEKIEGRGRVYRITE